MLPEAQLIRINSLKINISHNDEDLRNKILKTLRIDSSHLVGYKIVKRSLDARDKADIHYVYSIDAVTDCDEKLLSNKKLKNITPSKEVKYNDPAKDVSDFSDIVKSTKRPIVIGFGPAGMICAYKLAAAGLKPLIIERGADVDTRTEDVRNFWNGGKLNTSSNVQFGEGGAGTFSDGKLNTMIHDSFGRIGEVFRIFVENGADETITWQNKPHIGTDKLRIIVKSIRKAIQALGGEILFNTCMTGIKLDNGRVNAIVTDNGNIYETDTLVLAIGHSARDTIYMLDDLHIPMEKKEFAIGVRVQHPQELIGRAQYGDAFSQLPPADYKLTYRTKSEDRGVYSFCMCPGGFIVNASSEENRLVVNGMSDSARDQATANSAIVVTVRDSDFEGTLGGIELQRRLEEAAFNACHGKIPVQYLADFLENRATEEITSNVPNTKGVWACNNLRSWLPEFISNPVIEAFPAFGRTIKGFDSADTILAGLESRTSSPVRILRSDNLESVAAEGLYPCGEGAGYAGGITSAAVDGLKVYEAIINRIVKNRGED